MWSIVVGPGSAACGTSGAPGAADAGPASGWTCPHASTVNPLPLDVRTLSPSSPPASGAHSRAGSGVAAVELTGPDGRKLELRPSGPKALTTRPARSVTFGGVRSAADTRATTIRRLMGVTRWRRFTRP